MLGKIIIKWTLKKNTHEHDHITRSGRKESEKHCNLHYKKQCFINL